MAEVNKSVLVSHRADVMFDLVDAVERYPEFLPWCSATRLIHRNAGATRATVFIRYHGIAQSFTTENSKQAPRLMVIKLVEGPFRKLEGAWAFTPLDEHSCKIELSLRFEFASRVLDKLIGPVFGMIANNLVDAFVKRADDVDAGHAA